MATVNKRLHSPQASVINGIDAGGMMSAQISEGFESKISSAPDGLQLPVTDKDVQYVRGTVKTQDWVKVISLLTGTIGTYIFYERKSGVAEATGYVKHTLNNPVIHSVNLRITKGGYGDCTFSFECRAADETKTISDMHALTDSQAAPTYVTAARGGFRIKTAVHGALSIYHMMDFNFSLALALSKACNDVDVANTCVDAKLSGMQASGSITFQDGGITSSAHKAQQLIVASAASLVLVIRQAQGAADKTVTIAKVDFYDVSANHDVNGDFAGYTASFGLSNDPSTPLTLAGSNKILTIA